MEIDKSKEQDARDYIADRSGYVKPSDLLINLGITRGVATKLLESFCQEGWISEIDSKSKSSEKQYGVVQQRLVDNDQQTSTDAIPYNLSEKQKDILRVLDKGGADINTLRDTLNMSRDALRWHLKKLYGLGFINEHQSGSKKTFVKYNQGNVSLYQELKDLLIDNLDAGDKDISDSLGISIDRAVALKSHVSRNIKELRNLYSEKGRVKPELKDMIHDTLPSDIEHLKLSAQQIAKLIYESGSATKKDIEEILDINRSTYNYDLYLLLGTGHISLRGDSGDQIEYIPSDEGDADLFKVAEELFLSSERKINSTTLASKLDINEQRASNLITFLARKHRSSKAKKSRTLEIIVNKEQESTERTIEDYAKFLRSLDSNSEYFYTEGDNIQDLVEGFFDSPPKPQLNEKEKNEDTLKTYLLLHSIALGEGKTDEADYWQSKIDDIRENYRNIIL